MNAAAITIAPLVRPHFDNTHLGNGKRWALDNSRALAELWKDQSAAIGMRSTESAEDFDLWLLCQHDIEMALRGPISRLPHGSSTL